MHSIFLGKLQLIPVLLFIRDSDLHELNYKFHLSKSVNEIFQSWSCFDFIKVYFLLNKKHRYSDFRAKV